MKRIYTTILIMLLAFCPQAQRFEWAKGYRVDEDYKNIAGVVTDSLGNLYLLGACDASSAWDGEDFISPDMIPRQKNKANSLTDVVIAKLSPEGDMIWKKVIFSTNQSIPHDIRKLGDTAFACMVSFALPPNSNYTYFLDTFMYRSSNYPIDASYFTPAVLTGYLVFDFDGNMTEQHYLAITYTDSAGNDLVYMYDRDSMPWLSATNYENASFDVDSTGNIYISRRAVDYFYDLYHPYPMYDTIRGLKFWIDRRLAGEYRIPGHPDWGYPQLIKFSPHFDTLLACKYIIQRVDSTCGDVVDLNIKTDKNGNVYCMTKLNLSRPFNTHQQIVVDSVRSITLTCATRGMNSFLVKYDSLLNNKWVIYLADSMVVDELPATRLFQSIDFDYDSNLLFIAVDAGHGSFENPDTNAFLSYNGNAIRLTTAGFIAFQNGDQQPILQALKNIPANHAAGYGSPTNELMLCKGNRVYLQCVYQGGIELPSQTLRFNWNQLGIGFLIFDYAGNLIDGQDYGIIVTVPGNPGKPGNIVLNDSVVYFCNLLNASARFGDIDFPAYGPTNCIAKYVDRRSCTPTCGPCTASPWPTDTAASPRTPTRHATASSSTCRQAPSARRAPSPPQASGPSCHSTPTAPTYRPSPRASTS